MQQFKAAVFDMDGLLLDSEKLALKSFQAVCVTFDLGDLTNLFRQCLGTNAALGMAVLKEGLEGIIDYKEFSKAWNTEYTNMTKEKPLPLKEGAVYLLQCFKILDIPTGVATSTATKTALSKLRFSGIDTYFETVVGGDQVTCSKPDPEIYLKAASMLSSSPTQCIAFEDSANGVKAAVAAGMTVVQIPDLVQPDEALLKLGHTVLKSLADVPTYDFNS